MRFARFAGRGHVRACGAGSFYGMNIAPSCLMGLAEIGHVGGARLALGQIVSRFAANKLMRRARLALGQIVSLFAANKLVGCARLALG